MRQNVLEYALEKRENLLQYRKQATVYRTKTKQSGLNTMMQIGKI